MPARGKKGYKSLSADSQTDTSRQIFVFFRFFPVLPNSPSCILFIHRGLNPLSFSYCQLKSTHVAKLLHVHSQGQCYMCVLLWTYYCRHLRGGNPFSNSKLLEKGVAVQESFAAGFSIMSQQ